MQEFRRFNPNTNLIKNFSIFEGLPVNEFNIRAVTKDSNGKLYFGGVEGLISFHPESLNDSSFIPPVVLTSLTIDGKEIKSGEMIDQLDQFVLRWPQNSFEFEFAALEFSDPQKNQYAYELENFDKKWNIIGAKRNGRYTNSDRWNLFIKTNRVQ